MSECGSIDTAGLVRIGVIQAIETALEARLAAAEHYRRDAQDEANSHVGAMESRYDTFKEDAQYLAAGHKKTVARVEAQLRQLRSVRAKGSPGWPVRGALVVLERESGQQSGWAVVEADVETGFEYQDDAGRGWRVVHPQSAPGRALLAPFDDRPVAERLVGKGRAAAVHEAAEELFDLLETAGVALAGIASGVKERNVCSSRPPSGRKDGLGSGVLEDLRKDLAGLAWPGSLSTADRNMKLRELFVDSFRHRFPREARARLGRVKVVVPRLPVGERIPLLHEAVAAALREGSGALDAARWHRFVGDVVRRLDDWFVGSTEGIGSIPLADYLERWSREFAVCAWQSGVSAPERRSTLEELLVLGFVEALDEDADRLGMVLVEPGRAAAGRRGPVWSAQWRAVVEQVGFSLRVGSSGGDPSREASVAGRWAQWAEQAESALESYLGTEIFGSWTAPSLVLEHPVLVRKETRALGEALGLARKAWLDGAVVGADEVKRAVTRLQRAIRVEEDLERKCVELPGEGDSWLEVIRRGLAGLGQGTGVGDETAALEKVRERREAPGAVRFDEPSLREFRIVAVL